MLDDALAALSKVHPLNLAVASPTLPAFALDMAADSEVDLGKVKVGSEALENNFCLDLDFLRELLRGLT